LFADFLLERVKIMNIFMNSEQELNLVADKIKHDAPSWRIDFADSANAFTVWVDDPHRMMYCGSRTTLDEAWALAAEHVNLKNLYIAKGPVDVFGIIKFEKG
jgi:hypothetical protein